jgi:putative transposase
MDMDEHNAPWRRVLFSFYTYRRHPWLARPEAVQRLRTAFREVSRRRPWHWDGAVILPDAVHGMWHLPPDDPEPVSRWRAVKAHCTRHLRNWPGLPQGKLWQRGVEWREVASHEWRQCLDSIHWEPVRRGLAARPECWRYSSYRRCQRAGLYVPFGQAKIPFFPLSATNSNPGSRHGGEP